MRVKLAVPLLASILIMGTLGISYFPIADATHYDGITIALENTISDIETLVANDDLTEKDAKKLIKKLEKAISELENDNLDKALNEMDKFKKDTQKLIDKGKLGETEGQSLIDSVTAIQDSITSNTPPTIEITSPEDNSIHGETPSFSGTASDIQDGDLADSISWTSDLDGLIGTGGTITPTATLSEGQLIIITATVTDSDGATATASITVSFPCPPNCGGSVGF